MIIIKDECKYDKEVNHGISPGNHLLEFGYYSGKPSEFVYFFKGRAPFIAKHH